MKHLLVRSPKAVPAYKYQVLSPLQKWQILIFLNLLLGSGANLIFSSWFWASSVHSTEFWPKLREYFLAIDGMAALPLIPKTQKIIEKFRNYGMQFFLYYWWFTRGFLRLVDLPVIIIPEKRQCNQQGCAIRRGSFRGTSNFQMDTGIQMIFNSPD